MTITARPCHQTGLGEDLLIEQFASSAMCLFGVYNPYIGEADSLEDLVIQLCVARDFMRKIEMGLLSPDYPHPRAGMVEAVSSLIVQYRHML